MSSLVFRDALVVVVGAFGLGVPAALLSARALESLVFGVTVRDMATLFASAVLLLVVAVGAAGIPAWRAVRIDPLTALRAE